MPAHSFGETENGSENCAQAALTIKLTAKSFSMTAPMQKKAGVTRGILLVTALILAGLVCTAVAQTGQGVPTQWDKIIEAAKKEMVEQTEQ